MTSNIIFSTESGSDLPGHLVEQYGVYIAPMHVMMDGTDYLDGSIPVTDIYRFYDETNRIPSTSSTKPEEYTELFTRIRKDYPNSTIVHIGYTSKTSSSFKNVSIAAKEFDDIHLIDSLNVSGGLAAIVLYAAQLLHSNPDILVADLLKQINEVITHTRFSLIPGSLDFLRAGGQVSNATHRSASLLKIKPLIELIDGELTSTRKYRGNMEKVVQNMFKDYLDMYPINRDTLYLLYSVGLDESIKKQMEGLAREKGFQHVDWIEAGSVISSHAGPGGVGIAGIETF